MERGELLKLAKSVLSLPTAPYHEHAVRAFVIEYCRNLGLTPHLDVAGNVIVGYRHGAPGKPLVYVAHMDHPGFESFGGKRAEFLGGVPKEWFPGARVKFVTGSGVVRAKVAGIDGKAWPKRKLVTLKAAGTLRKGDFGMWDLPAVHVQAGKLHAPAIDDLLGVAVMLATLREVVRRKLRTHVWCVFTRAEEVGFHGAVEVARAGRVPRGALVISLEMSRERPWAQIGAGPVIRVGDRLTVFDPGATYFLTELARRSAIQAQRCLMDGGSCEATAFAGYGYRVGGLCLPLGNYHNIGKRRRIQAEYVAVRDLEGLVELTVVAAQQWQTFAVVGTGVRKRVEAIRRQAPRKLTA